MLASMEAIDVVGSAPGHEILAQIEEHRPDIIVAELAEAGDSLQAVWLQPPNGAPESPVTPVVALVDDPEAVWNDDALRPRLAAVLPRDVDANELQAAVRAAAAGLLVIDPRHLDTLLTAASIGNSNRASAAAASLEGQALGEPLTPREIEVLGMLAEGLGNKEIAAKLVISEHTVKFHVASIMGKLNAASRTEAVTIGIRRGLVLL
jgi:DNA-binding NarL/FixJ family response regulator